MKHEPTGDDEEAEFSISVHPVTIIKLTGDECVLEVIIDLYTRRLLIHYGYPKRNHATSDTRLRAA